MIVTLIVTIVTFSNMLHFLVTRKIYKEKEPRKFRCQKPRLEKMENLFNDSINEVYVNHIKTTIPFDIKKEIEATGKVDNPIEEFEPYLGFQYIINNEKVTIVSVYCIEKNTNKEISYTYGVTPVIEFSFLQKYIVNLVDTYADKVEEEKEFFKIVTVKESLLLDEDSFKLNLLKYIKDNKVTNTNLIKLKDFFMESNLFDSLKTLKENWTTEFCYFGDKSLCPESGWRLVLKSTSKKLGTLYNLVEDLSTDFPRESLIHNINYTENEIKEYVSLYNQTPISLEEAKVYKILMSNAVSNWFYYFLRNKGFNERKEIALIGLKGNRKSFIGFNTYGLFNLIDCYDKQSFNREINLNADLKNLYPICLPKFNDEIPGFSQAQKSRFKSKANGERTHFTKNNFNAGKDFHFDNSFEMMTANNIEVLGDDYDDKQFTYEPKKLSECDDLFEKSEDLQKKILNTFSSSSSIASKKLGKYIYDYLIKLDPNELMKDIQKTNEREENQFSILRFGEKILNELDIFKEIPLDKELFLNHRLSTNSNVESDTDKFKLYFEMLINSCERFNKVSLEEFFANLLIQDEDIFYLSDDYVNFYNSLNKEGIYLRKIQNRIDFVFTPKIVNRIKFISKNKFHQNFKYNTLRNLIDLFINVTEKPRNVFDITNRGEIKVLNQKSGYSIESKEIYELDTDKQTRCFESFLIQKNELLEDKK